MNNPALAARRADTPCPDAGRAARELAARIHVPKRLPPRHDGQPLEHLSHSSYQRLLACPEQWRRHYLQGEREPTNGAMFLGSQVDHALSTYYQHLLDHHDRLTLDQVTDAYREHWHQQLAETDIAWDEHHDAEHAFTTGVAALQLTFAQLVPHLGEPVAVQRRLEYRLTAGRAVERALLPGPGNGRARRRR